MDPPSDQSAPTVAVAPYAHQGRFGHDQGVMVLLTYRDPAIGPLLDDALAALAATRGFAGGWVGRSPDDADLWVLAARWSDAGAMRHGLGSFAAKMALGPLQAYSAGQDTVVEVLARARRGHSAVPGQRSGPGCGAGGAPVGGAELSSPLLPLPW